MSSLHHSKSIGSDGSTPRPSRLSRSATSGALLRMAKASSAGVGAFAFADERAPSPASAAPTPAARLPVIGGIGNAISTQLPFPQSADDDGHKVATALAAAAEYASLRESLAPLQKATPPFECDGAKVACSDRTRPTQGASTSTGYMSLG